MVILCRKRHESGKRVSASKGTSKGSCEKYSTTGHAGIEALLDKATRGDQSRNANKKNGLERYAVSHKETPH